MTCRRIRGSFCLLFLGVHHKNLRCGNTSPPSFQRVDRLFISLKSSTWLLSVEPNHPWTLNGKATAPLIPILPFINASSTCRRRSVCSAMEQSTLQRVLTDDRRHSHRLLVAPEICISKPARTQQPAILLLRCPSTLPSSIAISHAFIYNSQKTLRHRFLVTSRQLIAACPDRQ